MAFQTDLINYINRFSWQRVEQEKKLAEKLIKIYDEARKELYIRFIEAQSGQNQLRIQYLEAILADIEAKLRYYTNLTVKARQDAIDQAHITGQEFAIDVLQAGGIAIRITAGVGLINRGMVTTLIGDIPKLAGKVEDQVLFRIRDELTRGALMGEGIPKLAKRILGTGITQEGLKKPFSSLEARARVIARTEVIKASDLGYEDLAVRAQRVIGEEIFDAWITAGDHRVEAECRAIANGQDSRFQSIPGGYPGVYRRTDGPRPVIHTHPGCRCRRVPFLVSWAKSGTLKLEELKGRTVGEGKPVKDSKLNKVNGTKQNDKVKAELKPSFSETLRNKELEISGRTTEKCFVFDTKGSIILEKVGAKDHINFTEDELLKFENKIFTHNHPRGSSLSPADVAVASTWNLSEIRAVGTAYRYSMKRPASGWSRDLWENTIKPAVEKYDLQVRQEFMEAIQTGKMTIPQAESRHWHEVWTRVATELKLDYTKESW